MNNILSMKLSSSKPRIQDTNITKPLLTPSGANNHCMDELGSANNFRRTDL